jgi:hypothetical protein
MVEKMVMKAAYKSQIRKAKASANNLAAMGKKA